MTITDNSVEKIEIAWDYLEKIKQAQLLHCRPELRDRYDRQTHKELSDQNAMKESSRIRG